MVISVIDGTTYAGININAAVDTDFSAHPVRTVDFGRETEGERLVRRRKTWIAEVTVVTGS